MASSYVTVPSQQIIIESAIPRGLWSTEVCDCCAPSNGPLGFLVSLFFGQFYYGAINGVLDPRRDSTACAGNFGKSCLFYWMFQTIGSILCEAGQSCLPCGILGLIYCLINPNAILLFRMRMAVMKRFGIQGNPCIDCLLSYFCCYCSMAQMKAELEARTQTGEFVPYPTEGFKLFLPTTVTAAPMQNTMMVPTANTAMVHGTTTLATPAQGNQCGVQYTN